MSYYAKDLMEKVKTVEVPDLTDTNHIIIKKRLPTTTDLIRLDRSYLIEIVTQCLPADNASLLKDNWNNGSMPRYQHMKVTIDNIVGKMVKVSGTAFDISTNTDIADAWSGWLPESAIKVLGEI